MINSYFTNLKPKWETGNVANYGDSGEEGEWDQNQPRSGGMDYGQAAQGIGAGLSAGAANSEPVGDFNVDAYAGFKGSGQGLMSGGVIGAIVGGVTAQYGQFKKVNENLKKLDTSVDGVSYDGYGRPTYNGGAITNANSNVKALNTGVKKLNKTHLDPATNIISSFSGTRRRMKRKRAELQQGIQTAQQGYNQAELNYRSQAMAQDEYSRRMNDNSKMYNLMRFRS